MRRKRTRTKTITKLIGFAAIIAALVIIFTSGSPLLTQAIVESRFAQYAEDLKVVASQQLNAEATLTHGEISFEGIGFDKSAIIAKPTLTITRRQMLTTETFTVTTDRIVLIPDRAGTNKHYIDFPTPLTISRNGGPTTTVTFAGTPRYIVEQTHRGQNTFYQNAFYLPEGFTVAAAGGEVTQVSFSPRPDFRFNVVPATGASDMVLRADSVLIAENGGKSGVMIGGLSAQMGHGAPEGKGIPFTTELSLIDLGVKKPGGVTGGFYNFKLAVSGTTPTPEAQKAGTGEADITLADASLSKDNFMIAATGNVSTRPDDSLPFGEIKVTINNFGNVRDVPGSIPDEIRPFVLDAISLMTGQDPATIDDTEFTVRRDKMGVAQFGQASAEDMLKLIFARVLQPASSPTAAPALTTQ